MQTPDSVRAAGGRLMWPIPSHETELRLDTPDPVPMGTLGEEAGSDIIQRSLLR